MTKRGDVYFPDARLPPGQDIKHRVVVLSPNTLIAQQGGARLFVSVALIRSAVNAKTGRPIPLIMGHSIPIAPTELPALQHDSVVETHQLFAVSLAELSKKKAVGTVIGTKLDEILAGARLLFA
jgi:hypothetical protein